MEFMFYLVFLILCEAALAGIAFTTLDSISSQPVSSTTSRPTSGTSPATVSSTTTSTLSPEVEERIDERLQRSRLYRLFSLQRHVLDSLGWERPPDIDAETKRRLLGGMGTPLYVSRQKTCYYSACDLPIVNLPDYVNRTIWFDTRSRNIRLFFNMQANSDPNLTITSAVIKLHLKRRDDCPCAFEEEDTTTTRIHIKIYQYRKPVRSLSRLRHSNKRLIDAKMVTWEGARWVTFHVTEAVRRIIMRGKRNGGFEVHVRDMEENILDAKSIIDPTVCSSINNYDCSDPEVYNFETEETEDVNYSPALEIASTTTNRIDLTR